MSKIKTKKAPAVTTPAPHTATFTVEDLEQQILDLEGVRVVFRARAKLKITGVPYSETFTNAYKGNGSIQSFKSRITRCLAATNEPDLEYVIVDGRGNTPNYRTHMKTLRASYAPAAE